MSRFLPRLNRQWSNIVLIGMPGAGKSSLGVLLARELALAFIDTDLLIQTAAGKTLQQILDASGYLALRQQEEKVLCELEVTGCVIATGGSAVYSEPAMAALAKNSLIVFLDVPLAELRRRIKNYDQRGIARRPGQSFEALFEERRALYLRWADKVIECEHQAIAVLIDAVLQKIAASE